MTRPPAWTSSPLAARAKAWAATTVLALAGASAAQAPPSAALDGLLAAFDATYTPPQHILDEESALAATARSVELAGLPQLTFTEALSWRQLDTLDLSLSLDATLPLYVSRDEPLAALHAERGAAFQARARSAYVTARAAFVHDALAYALLRELAADAGRALERFRLEVWDAPTSVEGAMTVAPRDRDLLGLFASAVSLERFASQNLVEAEKGLARTLGRDDVADIVPSFEALYGAVLVEEPTVAACLERAPDAHAAELARRQRLSSIAVEETVDVRVGLSAGVVHTAALISGGPGASDPFRLRLGVEARVMLPDGWPVSGSVAASASVAGAEQSVRLTWPPTDARTYRDGPEAAAHEAERLFAEELDHLASSAAALLRSLATAMAEAQAQELYLLWLMLDGLPGATPENARALARFELADPATNLQAATYRADWVFALLNTAAVHVDLQVLCGMAPLGVAQGAPPR